MIRLSTLLVFLLVCHAGQSQIDSLKQVALSIWQSEPNKGFELAAEVYELALAQDDKLNISWVYNYKGIVFSAIGEMDSSYHYYHRSLAYCDEHGIEETKFKSLMNLARNYSFQGRYDEAMQAYLDVVEIFESRGDTLGLAHAYSGMGNIHKNLEQPLKAKADYLRSIGYYNALNKPHFTGILHSNLGVVYRDAGQLDSAQIAFDTAEEILTSTNHLTGLGSLYLNEGGMYEATDPKKALIYYQKGYELNQQLEDKRGVMIATLGLGQAHLNDGNWRKALVLGREGMVLAEEMNDLQHQALFSRLQYKAQKTAGNTALALDQLENYKLLSDSILNLESSNFIAELEVQYETEKKEKQLAEDALIIAKNNAALAESELEIKKGNIRLMGAIFLLLLAGIIAAWIYRTQHNKRIQAAKEFEMKSQLERIENQQKIAQEKVRISEELHDNIGAQLTFMINSVENLHYETEGPVKQRLETMGEFGRETMHELRNTIWAMNQQEGNTDVLEQKLAELKFRLSASIRIEITNSIAPPRELNAIQMLNCYRIVQEALQNVLKYAEATEVMIALSSRGAQTLLHITDNGKGFNVDEATLGNGLRNMRKRARTMGGEVQVTSMIEQGTTILVQL